MFRISVKFTLDEAASKMVAAMRGDALMRTSISPDDIAALHDGGRCGPGCCDLCDAADEDSNAARPLRCPVCWTRTAADAVTCAGCGQIIDPPLPLGVFR